MKSEPLVIPDDIAAKCNGPDQAERFDAGVRAFLSVPKSAVLKSEAAEEEGETARPTVACHANH